MGRTGKIEMGKTEILKHRLLFTFFWRREAAFKSTMKFGVGNLLFDSGFRRPVSWDGSETRMDVAIRPLGKWRDLLFNQWLKGFSEQSCGQQAVAITVKRGW